MTCKIFTFQANVSADQIPTVDSVTNASLATGTSPTASVASATATPTRAIPLPEPASIAPVLPTGPTAPCKFNRLTRREFITQQSQKHITLWIFHSLPKVLWFTGKLLIKLMSNFWGWYEKKKLWSFSFENSFERITINHNNYGRLQNIKHS